MKLERALALSSGLVALSGLMALLLTFESPLWLTLPELALVVAFLAGRRYAVRGHMLTAFTAVAIGFSVADFFWIGGSLVIAAADLMSLMLCVKIVSLNEDKDYVQLFAASFFLLLASTGLSTDIYFIVPFVAFFVSSAWALMLLTVRSEAARASRPAGVFRFGRGFFGGTALLSFVAFVVTLAIFFTIPRIGIGFISKRAGGLLRTSGFSDTVELGEMGEVKLDPTAVMRVRLPGYSEMPPFPLYWRGRTFDLYDGRSWKDTSAVRNAVYPVTGGRFYLRLGEREPSGIVVQEISLEPLDTATLFGLYPSYRLTSDFRYMQTGYAGEMFLPHPPGNRLHYTVYSSPDGGSYIRDDIPGPEHLQLPYGSAKLEGLAAEITAGIEDDGAKADAVMAYLGSGYKYTLAPSGGDTRDAPIDRFLFGARDGFCEHFATAMTLLLRASGVSARMVSGFMGGEWNAYGGYMLVRERDAHTWVEAYIPGEGWKRYDPTPASAASGAAAATKHSGMGELIDYLSYRWDRYIVYYNLRDQLQAGGWASDAFYDAKTAVMRTLSDIGRGFSGRRDARGLSGLKSFAAGLGVVVLLLLAGAGVWMYVRRRPGRREVSVRFYARLLSALESRGHRPRPGMTPMEFARSLPAGPVMLNTRAAYVTALYYRVRYGGVPLSRVEREKVDGVIKGISS